MPLSDDDYKSRLEIVNHVHSLIDAADRGMDVSDQIHIAIAMLDELDCSSLEDAMALTSLARTMYCRAVEEGIKGTVAAIKLVGEAEKHLERALLFMQAETGSKCPVLEVYRDTMH
jgi:hypothetical protein